MKHLLTLIVSVGLISAFAQEGTTFELAFDAPGLEGYSNYVDGAVAEDGSIALLSGNPQLTESQFIITRLHPDGSFAWSNRVSTTSADQWLEPRKTIFTSTGDILCFGLNYSSAGSKYFLVRLTGAGELLWSQLYAANVDALGGDYGFSNLHATPDGGASVSLGMFSKAIAMRVNAAGAVQWARSFLTTEGPTEKNPGFDFAALPDGGMLLCEKAESDIFLVRTDPDGDLLWSQRYPNGAYNHPKTAIGIADGGFLIAGGTTYGGFGVGVTAPFAMRLDQFGNTIWFKSYTFDECYVEAFEQAIELPDGTYLLTPTEYSQGLIALRVSPLGVPIAASTLSGNLSGYTDIIGTHDDEILASGVVTMTDNFGNYTSTIPVLRSNSSMQIECGSGTTGASTVDGTALIQPSSGCNVQDENVGSEAFNVVLTEQVAGTGSFCLALTGVQEQRGGTPISAFPNLLFPGSALVIDMGTTKAVRVIERYTTDGRQQSVVSVPVNQQRFEMNTTGWSTGVHTLRVVGESNQPVGTVRVVVQ
ncbi:MAG: hypothetical protein IPO90_03445 [Flavobacteriales bacterium]|nr:hypothetical protein [Flavobacteriales bacterium]